MLVEQNMFHGAESAVYRFRRCPKVGNLDFGKPKKNSLHMTRKKYGRSSPLKVQFGCCDLPGKSSENASMSISILANTNIGLGQSCVLCGIRGYCCPSVDNSEF